ncbi:unnamed protein product [Cylicostephanus goldi]|uniref:Thioredoxin domain-containing protein n=1 Tax=Cylicostephanus goldi TaxID=71465 RepID=A0A3P7M2T3_CYLGO|nr:unnamed protein product [Cylicostephanus goldi]
MKLGDTIPAFSATTNLGKIDNFHDWIGESWAILFSHPADFTPVCTTELARAAQLAHEFQARNVKMIALSYGFPFPIIADEDRKLAVELGMLDPSEKDGKGVPVTARAVFIVDPHKKIRALILYPATTGRNFE